MMLAKLKKIWEEFPHHTARCIVSRPYWFLALSLMIVVPTIWGIRGLKADFSYRVWFHPDDPVLKAFDDFERKFGNDDQVAVIVHSPSGVFDSESVKLVNSLTKELWLVHDVVRVDSLSNYSWSFSRGDEIAVRPFLTESDESASLVSLDIKRQQALRDPFLPGYLISPDSRTTVLFASLRPGNGENVDHIKVVQDVKTILKKYRAEAGDHSFHLGGSAALEEAFYSVIRKDMAFNVPASGVMIFLLLLFCFRNFSGIILPFIVMWTATAATLGAAHLMGIKFTAMLSIIPNILIAIGIANAIHILASYFTLLRSGKERKDAAYGALKKNVAPTFLTSFTTFIGFVSLAFADVLPVQHFGILTGFGTMLAWLLSFFILGPCLTLLPLKPAADSREVVTEKETLWIRPSAFVEKMIGRFRQYRWIIASAFLVGGVAFAIPGMKNQINSNPFEMFRKDVPIQKAHTFLENNFGAVTGPDIMLDSGHPEGIKDPEFLKKVDEFQQWLRTLPFVTKTVSIVDIIKKTHSVLNNDNSNYFVIPPTKERVAETLFMYTMELPEGLGLNNRVSLDNRYLRMTVLWTLHDSKSNLEMMNHIEKKASEIGLIATFSGKQLLHRMMNEAIIKTFFSSMFSVVLCIWISLVFAFHSLRMGSIALIPNVLPLMIGAGMVYLLKNPVDLGTIMVFSICLGIAVDDTIHFFFNYQALRREGFTAEQSVGRVLSTTGPALIMTTFVLVACFGTFILASFMPTVHFGVMTAIILSVALLCELVLSPTLLLILDGEDGSRWSTFLKSKMTAKRLKPVVSAQKVVRP